MRGTEAEKLIPLAEAMYEGGIRLLEITYSADGRVSDEATAENIKRLTEHFGDRMYIGAGTVPTEIQAAHRLGADFVKMFPVVSMGVGYVKAVRAPLSHIKMLAVGGVDEGNMEDYLRAGVVGFGVGSSIIDTPRECHLPTRVRY